MENMDEREKLIKLCDLAEEARKKAYAPVTGIKFGAALITKNERIFVGANNEDWSLTLTRHAEMCAIDKMLFNRKYKEDQIIEIIVVIGDPKSLGLSEPIFPCGVCRSYISQFSTKDTMVVALDLDGNSRVKLLSDLLPDRAFGEMKKEIKGE